MTTGYLMLDRPNPYTPQGTFPRRGTRGKLTGTCILHTSEGKWQRGVDSLTNLVRTRGDHGCYHRACDWQDIALYYPWEWETWQDTETNNWAVGIAAACKTSDWAIMPADVREGYYRNMARMAADFVQYMKKEYGITVPLARLSGAQARAGQPGFCAHGDSGLHRSDPGADFDWTTFFNYTRQALGSAAIGPAGNITKEDTLSAAEKNEIIAAIKADGAKTREYIKALAYSGWNDDKGKKHPGFMLVGEVTQQRQKAQTELIAALSKNPDLTAEQITAAVKAGLADAVVSVDVNVNSPQQ